MHAVTQAAFDEHAFVLYHPNETSRQVLCFQKLQAAPTTITDVIANISINPFCKDETGTDFLKGVNRHLMLMNQVYRAALLVSARKIGLHLNQK